MNKFLIFFALLIVLVFGGLYYLYQSTPAKEPLVETPVVVATSTLLSSATYICKDSKTISATYYEDRATTTTVAGQPPVPKGSVQLALNDGRTFALKQTISASGVRYANANESFVFWNKGNGALVLEEEKEKSYIGCVLVAPVSVGVDLPILYVSADASFSLRLPSLASTNSNGYRVDELFKNELSPKKIIQGVKFTIPVKYATGTNLSSDTYLSVENIPVAEVCTASLFFNDAETSIQKNENGVMYSVATHSDAGAGNRYQETVYALTGTNPCVAVRYMFHSLAIENYATGTVSAFNKETLTTEFDHIRKSLIVNQ